ncbi:hypothetical protein [Bradyrhizobium stylosanthis]|uniref:DUF2383 domain-containing protein n=1 Tax=Bradyrhizobium stylosanthis TaxID=1803665 RepID=A0A560D616_9BRAD|nr:hypothetical protein [Bradyrhizobium stylosanthis]TWA92552.1 hypothetical protein FBZ96_11022 [Bradyrhizobium stylosanthis]
MRDLLELLRTEAANYTQLSKLTADETKAEYFAKLAAHYSALAVEVEKAIPKAAGDDRL